MPKKQQLKEVSKRLMNEMAPTYAKLAKEPLSDGAIAKYQGAGDWGPKYGTLHMFFVMKDFQIPHKLTKWTTVTDTIVRELGGQLPKDLKDLPKGSLVYLDREPEVPSLP